ncbi:MAG: hypothetical protein HC925_02865 [Coleofasciculaceae cyanobacterium SM2_3_26]|nr:hypothetical protein [Coleofasciculaceae cyanobacterium SM2_3_26]
MVSDSTCGCWDDWGGFLLPYPAVPSKVSMAEAARSCYSNLHSLDMLSATSLVHHHQTDRANVIGSRLIGFDLSTLLAIVWTRTIVSVLAGEELAKLFAEFVGDPTNIDFAIALVALVFTIAFVSYFFGIRDLDFTKVFLLLGYLFLLLPSITFSLGDKRILLDLLAGQRYFFVPNVIFLLSVFYQSKFNTQKRNLSSLLCTFLVPISLLFNLFAYKPEFFLTGNWSSWHQEVSRWQADPAYPLQIWPPGWTVQLPPPSSLKEN